MYNSLFENSRYGLVPLREASFGTQAKDKMFKIFGSLLSKRIGKSVDTSGMLMDLFNRDGQTFGGIFYYIGDAGERLRINISMDGESSRPYSIDYWPDDSLTDDTAFVSIEIPVTMNLVQMMDYMTNVVKEKGRIPLDDGSDLDFMGEAVTPQTIDLVTDWIEQSGYDIPYLLKMKAEPLLNDYNASGSVEMDMEDFGGSLNKYLQSQGVHYAKLKRFRRGANKPKGGAASPTSKPKSKTKPVATKPSVSKPVLTAAEKELEDEVTEFTVLDTDLKGSIELLEEAIRDIGANLARGVLVTGTPGIGKTYTTQEILNKEFGLSPGIDYHLTGAGSMTPAKLFKLLHDNRDKLIVVDDNDALWSEQAAVNMIKGALQSEGPRLVESGSSRPMEGYEDPFEFGGQIIFISNLKDSQFGLAEPVLDRMNYHIHFNISTESLMSYVEEMLARIYKHVDMEIKIMAFEWFKKHGHRYKSAKKKGLSIRAYTKTLNLIVSGKSEKTWKRLSLSVL
jgi:hypothetical protein